jgi:polyisoprenoid-binding protein YceI
MINQTKWSISQANSEIAFKIRHLLIFHVKGVFKKFDASIYTETDDFENTEIDLWIDAASVSTGDLKRDEHLKSADFFDSKNHKQITFSSCTIGKSDSMGNHELWGKLTMKGISKIIKLNVQFGGIVNDNSGNEKVRFALTGKINRSDWGLLWNNKLETGHLVLSQEVMISCELELVNERQKDLVMELESITETNDISF